MGILNEVQYCISTTKRSTTPKKPARLEDQNLEDPTSGTRYSIFSLRRKRWIVFLMALASWLSTLSSFIYFPTITTLAKALNVSISKIDLTVTLYMVLSAIAPAVIGDLADVSGRRPVTISLLAIYVAANIGLAVQHSYVALLLLRMLQSAGISGVFALSYGVVADIASPAERGGSIGFLAFGSNTAPTFGPLIGTLLLAFRGWQSIFWFLTITSATCLVLVFFTLPETARKVVGNGSIRPPRVYRLPIDFSSLRKYLEERHGERARFKLPNPISCLYLLWNKNNIVVICTISILYMALNCLHASLSSLFIEIYGFNVLHGGLIYLPFGVSASTMAFLTGRMLNYSFKTTAREHSLPTDRSAILDLQGFPIVQARIKLLPYPLVLQTISLIGYGWTIHSRTHVAVPIILLFIMGGAIQSCFTMLNTLLVDLNNETPSTAQASCNVVRCAFAGLGTAVLHIMIDAMGVGWYFTLIGIICMAPVPFLTLQWRKGEQWRGAKIGESS